jgi:peptidoglycan hydrolase FlgJ
MINSIGTDVAGALAANTTQNSASAASLQNGKAQNSNLREAFDSFVGQTFFSQMLQSMRKTVDKPAFFNGGQTEEIFQQQLDSVMSEKLSKASADKFTGPMFELFNLQRK